MKFEIKSRFTGRVLFAAETESMKLCVEAAIKARAYLLGADLSGAYLLGADLSGAYLSDAYLSAADLSAADLSGADLSDAYLSGAYLSGANLSGADLSGAYLSGAYLSDADLSGAYLSGADLSDADLSGADLSGADLSGAYLSDAYLSGANLSGANLSGADLSDADLSDADLSGADLSGANLSGANLSGADLSDAYLSGAYLSGAKNVPVGVVFTDPTQPYERKPSAERRAEHAARYRERHPEVPVVEALDAKLLQIIESGAGNLNMATWHTCETTHCRAGWAIHLAGSAGADLEAKFGPQRAGAMIYRASTGRVPHFFASDFRALADIREQAQQQGVA